MRRTASVAERRDWDRLPISIPFFVREQHADGEEFLNRYSPEPVCGSLLWQPGITPEPGMPMDAQGLIILSLTK